MMRRSFRRGDLVVYRKTKCTNHPGPRAHHIHPAVNGEYYTYHVDKFWTVAEELQGEVLLITRRGKCHRVSVKDPNLRPARWWERWWYWDRFPELPERASA